MDRHSGRTWVRSAPQVLKDHERSKTMGGHPRPASFYDDLADFSQLDESTDAHEKVIRQARRLVGHAKLDSTQGYYFALKARGIDPIRPLRRSPLE